MPSASASMLVAPCLEDEAALLLDGAARCCEQVASDGAVDACAQCGAGGFGREVLPAAREPEACGRIDETEDGDGSDDFIVRHGRTVRKRRAGNRDEEVERNRGDLEAAQPAGEVDAVRHGLAHAEESARAEFESGAAGGLKRADLVGLGVRGADLGEKVGARLEVAVVAHESRLPQACEFGFGEKAH